MRGRRRPTVTGPGSKSPCQMFPSSCTAPARHWEKRRKEKSPQASSTRQPPPQAAASSPPWTAVEVAGTTSMPVPGRRKGSGLWGTSGPGPIPRFRRGAGISCRATGMGMKRAKGQTRRKKAPHHSTRQKPAGARWSNPLAASTTRRVGQARQLVARTMEKSSLTASPSPLHFGESAAPVPRSPPG